MNHIKQAMNQKLEQVKQEEEHQKIKLQTTQSEENLKIRAENQSKQNCYYHFTEYIGNIKDFSISKEVIANQDLFIRENNSNNTVRMKTAEADYKICVEYEGVRVAEMYRDKETPPNSIKLHIYQPTELIQVIEYEYGDESLNNWQHHIYSIKSRDRKKTYDGNSITKLFDFAFSEQNRD